MRSRYLQILIVLSLCNPLLSQDSTNAMLSREGLGLGLSAEVNSLTRKEITWNVSFLAMFENSPRHISKHEAINLTWISNDPYNLDKSNFSVFPVVNTFLLFRSRIIDHHSPTKNICSLLLTILNSTHHFLVKEPDYTYSHGFYGSNVLSLFVRNSTNAFVFRKHKWIRFAPGLGVGLMINANLLEIGISHDIDILSGDVKGDLTLHLSYSTTAILD